MKNMIKQFESKILEALEFKYRSEAPKIRTNLIEISPIKRMDIEKFYELYLEKGVYPRERIKKLIYQLLDIKIEMFYIIELDTGLYNHLIYNIGFDNSNINDFPYITLRKLSLDQTLIVKSRILWERIMNFIYYLERGKDLKGKSKKSRFFNFIKDTKWSYLTEYKDYIEWFDDQLRTPEVHKGSILRKYFLSGSASPNDKIFGLVNIVLGAVWINLLQIIQGEEPTSRYWNIAMENVKNGESVA